MTSIYSAMDEFLAIYEGKNKNKTAHAYKAALEKFKAVLESNHIPIMYPVKDLNFDLVDDFVALLQEKDETTGASILTVATERLYLTAFRRWVSFLSAQGYSDVNVIRVQEKIKLLQRTEGFRILNVDIEGVREFLKFVDDYQINPGEDEDKILRIRRDRALIFVLAESGFRIEEACTLIRGNVILSIRQARIIGKGDKEALVRISRKAIRYLNDYLSIRQKLDGGTGKGLLDLPLFARHDQGAGKKIRAITTTTGRAIINHWVGMAKKAGLLKDLTSPITPHTLRHFYVTMVYEATGDLKIAQELARHESTETTNKYTHLVNPRLDEAFELTFEQG